MIASSIISPILISPPWHHSRVCDTVKRLSQATGNRFKGLLHYIRESIASFWWKNIVPLCRPSDLDAIKSQVSTNVDAIKGQVFNLEAIKHQLAQVQSSLFALEEQTSSLAEQWVGHADNVKTLVTLVGYQAGFQKESVRQLQRLQEQERADWKMQYKVLQKLLDDKLLSFQTTVTGLSSTVDKIGREHTFLTAVYQQMVFIQKKIEGTQKSLLDRSLPTSDSIERVQTEVDSLRSYLLEEVDSRRSLLEGRKGSIDWKNDWVR